MKKILITGANSYIGTNLEKWLKRYPDDYSVDVVETKTEEWKGQKYSEYDTVFCVTGIAHVKETRKNADLYYKVNRDLAYEIAQVAKNSGVKQFIFLSSMSVYGIETGVISRDTMPNPKSNYGKSKLQAEKLLESLQDNKFLVAILRPPMVYGKDCKGNYPKLAKFAIKTPIFPDVENKRSMIYIDNLSEFIRLLIDNGDNGIFFPQNEAYVCTSEMVKIIAEIHGKNLRLMKWFNFFLRLLSLKIRSFNKMFGSFMYDMVMSEYSGHYTVKAFEESIKASEE